MMGILFILSCLSDNLLTHEVEKVVYEDREVEVIVEVEKEVEVPVEDTAEELYDIWVEHFIQPTSTNGVDILWVIDPSGSMIDDKPQIIDGISDMMNALPLYNWRLAIISSDYRTAEGTAEFPLIPGDTAADAEAMYEVTVTGYYEAGFDAVFGYVMNNPYAHTWMRNDAALLIVFVSDEEEQSKEYFNSTNQFLNWASNVRNSVFIASIVNFHPDVSLCNYVQINTGDEYMAAANHFSGQIIDICSDDWSSGVADASNQVTPHEYWDLAKTPINEDAIHVFYNGVEWPQAIGTDFYWNYNVSENRVYFDKIPEGNSLVEIAYQYQ